MANGSPQRTKTQSLLVWLPPVLWMVLIYRSSSLSASEMPSFLPDYVFHFFAYAVLGALFLRAFGEHKTTLVKAPFWAISTSVIYAVFDELHQSFVPTRDCSFKDFIVDVVAVLLIVLIAVLVKKDKMGS